MATEKPQKKPKTSLWERMRKAEEFIRKQDEGEASLVSVPEVINLKLKSGLFFGIAIGIGFCIGFLISLFALLGIAGLVVYSKFPELFG